jgi:hypothetical protein
MPAEFYPRLSRLVRIDELPEMFNFVTNPLQNILDNIYYKDLVIASGEGNSLAYYSMTLMTDIRKATEIETHYTGNSTFPSYQDNSGVPYNINVWPMYGLEIEKEDDDGKKYLYGKPFDFKSMKNGAPEYLARIPLEDTIAYGVQGLFKEIQSALNELHKKYISEITDTEYEHFKWFCNINHELFIDGNPNKFFDNNPEKPEMNIQSIAGIELLYRSIDQIARVAREKVYFATNPDQNLSKYSLLVDDPLDDQTIPTTKIGIRTKLKKYYENICISSDFDGIDDPLDLFASPRMYPVMVLYIANRLKWDLYRRYYGKDSNNIQTGLIEGNEDIGPERGQSLNVDDGVFFDPLTQKYGLDELQDDKMTDETRNNTLNGIVKDIMKQILDTNFINMIANARGWNS